MFSHISFFGTFWVSREEARLRFAGRWVVLIM
jgi:hypothetical protein